MRFLASTKSGLPGKEETFRLNATRIWVRRRSSANSGAVFWLRTRRMMRQFPGVRISVPPAVVIATDQFDQFLAENNLGDFALHCDNDSEIQQRFLEAALPRTLQENLKAFLGEVDFPLAVRQYATALRFMMNQLRSQQARLQSGK